MSIANETPGPQAEGPVVLPPDGPASLVGMLRSMMRIRAFEEQLMRLPHPGFQLLSSGEEAVSVGLCAALAPEDQLLSSGRSIAPALARGLDPTAVLAELLGKVAGPCKGKGGRGHLAQPKGGFFGAHPVVGGNLTIAAGVALAMQLGRSPAVVACLFGDGACGAGALHETLNIAALWKLPLFLVCCNNQYSVSTPVSEAIAARRLSDLAGPHGIPGRTVDGMDVLAVRDAARAALAQVREGNPFFLECIAYGFAPHSSASRESRPKDEILRWRARCPIRLLAGRLCAQGLLDEAAVAGLQRDAEAEAESVAARVSTLADPDPSETLTDVD
jgi:pyruvate dehydrogenase E1 component alpha subunit